MMVHVKHVKDKIMNYDENFKYFCDLSYIVLQSTFCSTIYETFCFKISKQGFITEKQIIEFDKILEDIKNKELEYLFNIEIYQKDGDI